MTNYKCIVTLHSGAHKLVRMTRDVVAHIVRKFREYQKNIFNDVVVLIINGQSIRLNDVAKILFVNEYTGERLEIV